MSFSPQLKCQAILASTWQGGIGYKGKLPWKLDYDLSVFQCLTTNVTDEKKQNAVIMGRKTWQSLPKNSQPLPNRLNIIISKTELYYPPSVHKFATLGEALRWCGMQPSIETAFICGGKRLYDEAIQCKYCSDIYVTWVEGNDIKCDTFIDKETLRLIGNEYLLKSIKYPPQCDDASNLVYFMHQYALFNVLPPLENKNPEEMQYLDLLRNVLFSGVERPDRTGVGVLGTFGTTMKFDLRNGKLPLLTTKTVFFRGVLEELLWFIRGSTDSTLLHRKGIKIWDGNGSREYLDSIGLSHRREGDLGPVYGFQWRHFGAEYKDCETDYSGQGVDQLQNCINQIKTNPESRRIVLCAWNVRDLPHMALPPCHLLCQFWVHEGELSCQFYQRSCDLILGVPFNIASYALLTHLLAHICGLQTGDLIHVLGDIHIYKTHLEAAREQICRTPDVFPRVLIKCDVSTPLEQYTDKDFELIDYHPQSAIKATMAL